MVKENVQLPTKEFQEEKLRRENLKMNQTFNLTSNSFMAGASTVGDATVRMNQTGAFGNVSETNYAEEGNEEMRDEMPMNKTHSGVKAGQKFLKKGLEGMRSTQVTLDQTRNSSKGFNLTARGKGSESSHIFGSTFKNAHTSSKGQSLKKTKLNNNSSLRM